MALSVVLVASVFLVYRYAHMHSNLYILWGLGYRVYERFAHCIAMFWGATLTATVVSVYVPHLLVLRHEQRRTGQIREENAGRSNTLEKIGIALSILGPLLAAVLTKFVER